jgi:hypothetical protein
LLTGRTSSYSLLIKTPFGFNQNSNSLKSMEPPEISINNLVQSRIEIVHEALQRGLPFEKTQAYLELLRASQVMVEEQILLVRDRLDVGIAEALSLQLDAEGPKAKKHTAEQTLLEDTLRNNGQLEFELNQLLETQNSVLIEILQYEDYLVQQAAPSVDEDLRLARELSTQLNPMFRQPFSERSKLPPLAQELGPGPITKSISPSFVDADPICNRLWEGFKVRYDNEVVLNLAFLPSDNGCHELFTCWDKTSKGDRLEIAATILARSSEPQFWVANPKFDFVQWLDKEIAFMAVLKLEAQKRERDCLIALLWCSIDSFEAGDKLLRTSVNKKDVVFQAGHRRWLKLMFADRPPADRVSPAESRARLRHWASPTSSIEEQPPQSWLDAEVPVLVDLGRALPEELRLLWLSYLHERCYALELEFIPILEDSRTCSLDGQECWLDDPGAHSAAQIAFLWSTVSNSQEAGLLTCFFGLNKDSVWYMNAWTKIFAQEI